jgi:hypothetical protein
VRGRRCDLAGKVAGSSEPADLSSVHNSAIAAMPVPIAISCDVDKGPMKPRPASARTVSMKNRSTA